jgi:hypothetical protein
MELLTEYRTEYRSPIAIATIAWWAMWTVWLVSGFEQNQRCAPTGSLSRPWLL